MWIFNRFRSPKGFWQKICQKKCGQVEPFLSFKYALNSIKASKAKFLYERFFEKNHSCCYFFTKNIFQVFLTFRKYKNVTFLIPNILMAVAPSLNKISNYIWIDAKRHTSAPRHFPLESAKKEKNPFIKKIFWSARRLNSTVHNVIGATFSPSKISTFPTALINLGYEKIIKNYYILLLQFLIAIKYCRSCLQNEFVAVVAAANYLENTKTRIDCIHFQAC